MFENHNGALNTQECNKVKSAIHTLSTMWFPPTKGFYENGVDYSYIDFIDTKKHCMDALNIVREFIETFAPDVDED